MWGNRLCPQAPKGGKSIQSVGVRKCFQESKKPERFIEEWVGVIWSEKWDPGLLEGRNDLNQSLEAWQTVSLESDAGRWGQLDKILAGHVEGEKLERQTATLSKKEFSFILKAVANSLNPDRFKQWIILAFWKMTVDYLEDPWDKIQPEARIRKVMGTVDEEIVSLQFSSVQFHHSVASSTLCDPMDCSMPDLPVHHQLPEFTQTYAHRVGDAIQPSHPLSSPSPAFNLSQHQGLFKWVSSSHQVAKGLEFQIQHQSFQWIFRTDFSSRVKRN